MKGSRAFRGWHVVGGMFLDYMVIVGIVMYTLPLFYPALMAEFGWSAAQVTLGATVLSLGSALLTPFASALYDRFSVRAFMTFGACCTVAALALYSRLSSLTMLVALYVLLGLGPIFAGQVPVMVVLSRWFRRRRGLAMGIVLTATGAGGALFPLLVRPLLAEGEWRQAALRLALAATVLFALALLLLIRNRPEDLGQYPDGDPAAPETREGPGSTGGPSLGEALRSPVFWLLAFATAGLWFVIQGLLQHQSILLTNDLGVDAGRLPLVVSAFFWFSIIGKVAFGWLGDRGDKASVLLLSTGLLVLGLLLLRHVGASAVFAYALCFGLGFGGAFTLMQLLIAQRYAGQHYGRILGVLTMADVLAGGVAIPVLALLSQHFGSYFPVLDLLVLLCLAIAAAVLPLRRRGGAASRPVLQQLEDA